MALLVLLSLFVLMAQNVRSAGAWSRETQSDEPSARDAPHTNELYLVQARTPWFEPEPGHAAPALWAQLFATGLVMALCLFFSGTPHRMKRLIRRLWIPLGILAPPARCV